MKEKDTLFCKECNYLTTCKKSWKRHISTRKHINNTKNTQVQYTSIPIEKKKKPPIRVYQCDVCQKIYKFQSGLSRHKMKCYNQEDYIIENSGRQNINSETKYNTVIDDAKYSTNKYNSDRNEEKISDNTNNEPTSSHVSELQKILEKTIISQNETIQKLLPKIGNHTTNYNNMTVNVFLNNKCNNAMNLTEFMNKIQLSLDDVVYTKDHGYIKGITKIFVKNLEGIKPTERPIHCSDNEQLSFYIREKNRWENDNSNLKIDRSIESLTQKQIQKMNEHNMETNQYMETMKSIMDGINGKDREKNFEVIKKELGDNTNLEEVIKKNEDNKN